MLLVAVKFQPKQSAAARLWGHAPPWCRKYAMALPTCVKACFKPRMPSATQAMRVVLLGKKSRAASSLPEWKNFPCFKMHTKALAEAVPWKVKSAFFYCKSRIKRPKWKESVDLGRVHKFGANASLS